MVSILVVCNSHSWHPYNNYNRTCSPSVRELLKILWHCIILSRSAHAILKAKVVVSICLFFSWMLWCEVMSCEHLSCKHISCEHLSLNHWTLVLIKTRQLVLMISGPAGTTVTVEVKRCTRVCVCVCVCLLKLESKCVLASNYKGFKCRLDSTWSIQKFLY